MRKTYKWKLLSSCHLNCLEIICQVSMAYFLALFPKIMRVIMGQYWANHYFSRSCWPVSTVFDTKKSGGFRWGISHMPGLKDWENRWSIHDDALVGGFNHGWIIFHFIYGMSSQPHSRSPSFSRWLKHVKITN